MTFHIAAPPLALFRATALSPSFIVALWASNLTGSGVIWN